MSNNELALKNATENNSLMNYAPIIEGFMAKGIPAEKVIPRVNVFTYKAWLALGRQVRKGEKGVKVVTFVLAKKKDGTEGTYRIPKTTTVFHLSQTEEVK